MTWDQYFDGQAKDLLVSLAVFAALGVVVWFVLLLARGLRRRERNRLVGVRVGDLWECREERGAGLYEVVGANASKEAGPDSWVMRCVTDDRPLYMHLSARERGEWTLVMRDGSPTELWFRAEQTGRSRRDR